MTNFTVADVLTPASRRSPGPDIGWQGPGRPPSLEHDWSYGRFSTTVHLVAGRTVVITTDYVAASVTSDQTQVQLTPAEARWLRDVVVAAHRDSLRGALVA